MKAGRQRGVSLLALVALLSMGATWYLMSALNAASDRTAIAREHNARVLETAKQALLGWAAQNALDGSDNNPGRVPCPEPAAYINDAALQGIAAGGCGTGTVIGRLPWRTLGLPKLLDAAGEPLWYVVSDGWKLDGASDALGINSNSQGSLMVGGTAAVAAILAPGPSIALAPSSDQVTTGCATRVQMRDSSAPNYLDYLECHNIAGGSVRTYVTGNASNPVFNDQVVMVSAAEVLAAIEGPVAERLERDIVPKLVDTYVTNAAQWGATSANPVFPYAAPFADPATSSFKGEMISGTPSLGLMPMTASTCGTLTDGHCDSTFIQWRTTGITVAKNSGTGTLGSVTCTGGLSSGSQIRCNITVTATCGGGLGSILGGTCTVTMTPNITITATADNVGKAFRTLLTAGIVNLTDPSMVATIGSTGNATVQTTGTLSATDSCNLTVIFGFLFPCTASATVQVTIPITTFADHPLNTATKDDSWYWFTANRWYDVTYYAVALSNTPSGAHNCQSAGTCLSVSNGSPASNIKALLVLAGRSLNGTTGTNRALSDFLDSAENQDIDRFFEQNRISRSFNDRFVSIANY